MSNCTCECLNDNITLPTGAKGDIGTTGAIGTAKFAVLTNETSAITSNLAGTAQTGTSSTIFRIFNGTTEVDLSSYIGTFTSNLSASSAGVLATLGTSLVGGTLGITTTFTWSGFTSGVTNAEWVEMTLTISSTTYVKRWNLVKIRNAS